MTVDALQLDVPDASPIDSPTRHELEEQLAAARQLVPEEGLRRVSALLSRVNRSALTLLERQRMLQSFSHEYSHYTAAGNGTRQLSPLALLCGELAIGYKRLSLQLLQGRSPSRPHLAWCLFMAQFFVAQTMLRHYQQYLEPAPGLWRDSHTLYGLGEQHDCLDDGVAAALLPTPADTLRGLYQQTLLLALSNPFHLQPLECLQLFAALAPLAKTARLLPWDVDDECEGPLIDLRQPQPSLTHAQRPGATHQGLRRLETGALLIAITEPAPLQSDLERQLIERVHPHWLGREQRRHPRTPQQGTCRLAIGLPAIHAQLLQQRPACINGRLLDISPGGVRLVCDRQTSDNLSVGQLVLLSTESSSLALICWQHLNEQGLHLGLRYLKGLPQAGWLRRTPSSQAHIGILQSTPQRGSGWQHGLWLPHEQFSREEVLWLQLPHIASQQQLVLPDSNMTSAAIARYPITLP